MKEIDKGIERLLRVIPFLLILLFPLRGANLLICEQPGEVFLDFEDLPQHSTQILNYYADKGIRFGPYWYGALCPDVDPQWCSEHPPRSGNWEVVMSAQALDYINLDFPATQVDGWFTNSSGALSLNLYAWSGLSGNGIELDHDVIGPNPGEPKEQMLVTSSTGMIKSVGLIMLWANQNSMDDLNVIYAAPTISVTADDDTIAAGDTLVYDAVITNTSSQQVTFFVLGEIINPDNDTTQVVNRRLTLAPNQQLVRNNLKIPMAEDALTGTHTFRAYTKILLNSDFILSEDSFDFNIYKVASITPDEHIKVLISKPYGGGYPSEYQVADSTKGRVLITATIDPVFQDQEIYFRIYDPCDSSSYTETTCTAPVANDNKHEGFKKGNLKVPPTYTKIEGSEFEENNEVIEVGVKTDLDGTASVILTITNQYAGDNYQVYAAGHPVPKPNQEATQLTKYMVAWKRIYFEEDMMYRVGSDLVEDFFDDGNSMSDTIEVEDARVFAVDDVVEIFDALNPVRETAVITAVDTIDNLLALDDDLTGPYYEGYPKSIGQGAAVAVPAAGFFNPDVTGLVPGAYGSDPIGKDGGCFVEIEPMITGNDIVPFKESLGTTQLLMGFYQVWFASWENTKSLVWVCGASYKETPLDGFTGTSDSTFNFSYIWLKTIEDTHTNPTERALANANWNVHELGHQFNISEAEADTSHQNVLNHEGSEKCVMDYYSLDHNNITEFCLDGDDHLHDIRGLGSSP